MLICFSGSGWMFPFHFGVAKYVQDHRVPFTRFAGVSGGAAVALTLACGLDALDHFNEALAKSHVGLFGMCDAVLDVCESMLARAKVRSIEGDRLYVQMSTALMQPHLVSEFESTRQCVEAIRASAHIPVVGGLLPYKVEGMGMFYDGGLASMLPLIPDRVKMAHRVVRVDATGSLPSCDIHLGFHAPYSWIFVPRPLHTMRLIFRYGYLKAKQFFEPLSEELIHREIHWLEKTLQASSSAPGAAEVARSRL
jgi:predicted acylesterase/phospholipase RssA